MTLRRPSRTAVAEAAILLLFAGAGLAASVRLRGDRGAAEAQARRPVGTAVTGDAFGPDLRTTTRPARFARLARSVARDATPEETPLEESAAIAHPTAPAATTVARPRRPRPVTRTIRQASGVSVTPKGIAVVQVPVPSQVVGDRPIGWEARPTEETRLLSAASGVLAARDTSLTVVVRAPETALAGRLDAAAVVFSGESTSVQTIVSIEIARIRRPAVRLDRGLVLVPSGERVVLRGTVSNLGNSTDTLLLSAAVPSVLDANVSPRRVVLAPGESRPLMITLRHRDRSSAGDGFLVVHAATSTGDTATSRAPVDVVAAARRQSRGPYMQLGAVTVLGDSLGATPVLGATLSGTYRDNIQLFGQAVRPLDQGDVNTLGLARVGYSLNGAFLSASAPAWRGRVGVLSERATTTTGENIFGVGVSGGAHQGAWDGSAIFATSPSWVAGDGRMYSATAGYTGKFGRGSVTASSLRDGFAGARSLDAVGVGMETALRPGLTVAGELAYRAFEGDHGIGAATTGEFRSSKLFGRAEFAHTPGGTAAFATATDRAAVAGGIRLTPRIALQGSGFHASDRAAGRNPSSSRGLGAGVATELAMATTLDLSLTARSFETEATPAAFGNEETTVKASLRTRIHGVLLGGYAGGGRSARTLTPVGGSRATITGARQVAGASAALPTAAGSFGVALDYESNAEGTGFLPRALSVGAYANQLAIPGLRNGPRLDLGLQYYDWFETRPAGLQIRVGTEYVLNDDLRTRLVVERDPFIRAVGSSTPWVLSLRIDRGIRLPTGHRPAVRGQVYVDRNANGAREPSEEALAGVRVRRGNDFVTTDRNGRFQFDTPGSAGVALDPLSLPEGQVPMANAGPGNAEGRILLPVVPTAPLSVHVRYQADSLGRVPSSRLDRITVNATDTAGVVWALRADEDGAVIFDALPPGRYTVTPDVTNLEERLRLVGAAPTVTVQAGGDRQDVILTLAVRPVRLFNMAPGTGDPVGARRR